MNILGIVGSPRKGKATDRLVQRAVEGAWAALPDAQARIIHLVDHDIQHCRNCLTCRDDKTDAPLARCMIRDDMDAINQDLLASDLLVVGSPVHMGSVNGRMLCFLERICWVFARPCKSYLTVRGCPGPRSDKKRRAVVIVCASIVPPYLRMFCNDAAPLIKCTLRDSLRASTVGSLYAGALERRGVEHYLDKAFKLGRKLAG